MQLFQSFSEFLLTISGVNREQLNIYADNCKLIPSGKDQGNCMELGQLKYEAVFEVTHFKGEATLFLAHVLSWLEDKDPYRFKLELPDPDVEVSPVDRETVDLDLSIQFEEPLILRRDEQGPIEWNCEKWSVCPLDIDVATELEKMDGKSEIQDGSNGS